MATKAQPKRKSNAGRKGLYKEWLEADIYSIEGWARDWLTDEQIAA